MGAVQSDNRLLSILAGFGSQYIHSDGGETTTITPKSGQTVTLQKILLNTNGAAVIIRDTSGVIGVIAADAPEQTFPYALPVNGTLYVENPGASDITIVFTNR